MAINAIGQGAASLSAPHIRLPVEGRKPFLDLIRAVAVILVLARHADLWMGNSIVSRLGWMGVDIFFVLSGYLIMGLLLRVENLGAKDVGIFYARRAFKIIPSFWFLLILAPFVNWEGFKALLVEMLFLQSYLPHIYGHTWSISVEEHFYLILPIVVWLVRKRSRSKPSKAFLFRLVACLWAWVILILCARIIHLAMVPVITRMHHVNPSCFRMDSMLLGCIAQVLRKIRSDIPRSFLFGLLGMLVCVLFIAYSFSPYGDLSHSSDKSVFTVSVGFTLIAMTVACLLLLFGDSDLKFPGKSLFDFIAVNSYNIYLIHFPIQLLVGGSDFLRGSNWGLFVYLSLSLLLGALLTRVVEVPFLAIRKRFLG